MLDRFPFTLPYQIVDNEIVILALATRAGDPDIGRGGGNTVRDPSFSRAVESFDYLRPQRGGIQSGPLRLGSAC